MNKYLMLSAAALLSSAAPAAVQEPAKSHTIHFYSGSGANSYCDGMTFQKVRDQKHIAVGMHLYSGCGADDVQVAGTVNKTAFTLNEDHFSGITLMYEIYKPIRNNGSWDVWACYSGTSCFQADAGIYKLGYPGGRRQSSPTTAKVAELVAARRAARHLKSQ